MAYGDAKLAKRDQHLGRGVEDWSTSGMMTLPESGATSVHLHSLMDELNANRKFIPALAVLQGKWVIQLRGQGNRVLGR